MRAKEFITEKKEGSINKSFADVNPGAVYTPDKYYDLYRVAMIMGRLPEKLEDVDAYSWIGMAPFIGTYTKEEYEMAKKAFAFMGVPFETHVKPGSKEPEGVNTESPMKAFKGYKGTQRRSK